MNKIIFILRKLMAWGNPRKIEDLNKDPNQGWWESFGW
jgi:hypothetical protein|tara:strand:- start:831 stop:944 length:114 start_codon:yes stop_codon:yes gene_type:complete